MTEQQWLTWTDPQPMLHFYLRPCGASDRKLRLFACVCIANYLRLKEWVLTDADAMWTALAINERYADGMVQRDEWLRATRQFAVTRQVSFSPWETEDAWQEAAHAIEATSGAAAWNQTKYYDFQQSNELRKRLAKFLRCVAGNPFRPVIIDPAWLAWHDGTVTKIAKAIYDERRFTDLPILADALEEAGCRDADILGHCRSEGVTP
jgi:hypothetical protein